MWCNFVVDKATISVRAAATTTTTTSNNNNSINSFHLVTFSNFNFHFHFKDFPDCLLIFKLFQQIEWMSSGGKGSVGDGSYGAFMAFTVRRARFWGSLNLTKICAKVFLSQLSTFPTCFLWVSFPVWYQIDCPDMCTACSMCLCVCVGELQVLYQKSQPPIAVHPPSTSTRVQLAQKVTKWATLNNCQPRPHLLPTASCLLHQQLPTKLALDPNRWHGRARMQQGPTW